MKEIILTGWEGERKAIEVIIKSMTNEAGCASLYEGCTLRLQKL
jgi:hypothetical protein